MLPDQEQRSKLAIIYEIYKQRLPKAFEVYRCSKESTEEEIGVFFERVSFFRYIKELIRKYVYHPIYNTLNTKRYLYI